jgi:phosphotransferase system enzyme I (PtsI)
MGFDELSVSPGRILPLRKIVLETDVSEYKKSRNE